MNGFSRRSHTTLSLGAAGAFGLALAGCADLRRSVTLPPVNPESPVAGIVAPASRLSYTRPRLSDVPPLPKNVPYADKIKTAVVSLVRCRGGLERFPVTHPPLSGGTEQFAANARDVAQVNPTDVPPSDSAARSDAFAASLRAAVEPPAAIASGPDLTADQSRPPSAGPAPRRPAPARALHHAAAPPPAVTPTAAPTPPAQTVAAPAQVVQSSAAPPPLPAPLPDPLLARCT